VYPRRVQQQHKLKVTQPSPHGSDSDSQLANDARCHRRAAPRRFLPNKRDVPRTTATQRGKIPNQQGTLIPDDELRQRRLYVGAIAHERHMRQAAAALPLGDLLAAAFAKTLR